MTDEPKSPTLGDVASAAGFSLGLLTAWLYSAGWSYAYTYFDRFRIPLSMVDLPIEYFLIYGGLVFWKNWQVTLVFLLLLIASLWCCYKFSRVMGRFGLSAISFSVILLVFVLCRFGGVSAAWQDFQNQRKNDFPAYPRVRLTLTGDQPSHDPRSIADLVDGDCGRLLLHNQERLFLIRPIRDHSVDLDTFILPWSEVKVLRVIADYRSCP